MTGSMNLKIGTLCDSQEISHQKKFDSHLIKKLHAERATDFIRVKLLQGKRELHTLKNVKARGYCIKDLSSLL